MAGKLVNNPMVRMALENGVDGAINGAGGYLTGPGPHTPTGFFRATALGGGTGAIPIGRPASKVDLPPAATTKLGDMPPTLEGMRGNPAANFTDGAYTSRFLSEDTILYRGGEAGTPWGRWWSEDAPISVEQVRNDKAVLPEWPEGGKSPIDSAFMARFPAGTAVYEGIAAPQTALNGTVYPGGTPQVYVPDARTAGEILKEWKLD